MLQNKHESLLYLFIWDKDRMSFLKLYNEWPFQPSLNTYSSGVLHITLSPGIWFGSVICGEPIRRLWQDFGVWGRQVKGNKWTTGDFHCCYTAKSQEMLGAPPQKVVHENSTHCARLWSATCKLVNTDMIYARRVGMSPLCVDRMWTALGKHTAGNESSTPFPSLFFWSSWPVCVLLHSWVGQTSPCQQSLSPYFRL